MMESKIFMLITAAILLVRYMVHGVSSNDERRRQSDVTREFCHSEYFKPQCLKNEVIVMKSATYGRMHIGKCITEEEIADQGKFIQDSLLLGCSKDVLATLNEKCSGKSECEIKVADSTFGKVKTCLTGLIGFLEAEYDCITVADEERSCSVIASKTPIHIIQTLNRSKTCGTKSQPWIIEAPIGQKISFTLFDYSSSSVGTPQTQTVTAAECVKFGVIVDKTAKVNKSICRVNDAAGQKGIHLYTSRGNTVHVYMTSSDDAGSADVNRRIILRVETVGCSDIIPPEDTWLKRSEDDIVIGCYSSRHTWRLSCKSGKWVGVLGNCSRGSVFEEPPVDTESTQKPAISRNAQVLVMVAIGGFTVAVCLTIVCIGALCFKRYTLKMKRNDYKTLSYSIGTTSQRQIPDHEPTVLPQLDQISGSGPHSLPTYSVYVGDSGHNDLMNIN